MVVISGGFAEAGPEGRRCRIELIVAARAGGVRVVGPNCFGVQNCDLPLNASLAAGTPPRWGRDQPGDPVRRVRDGDPRPRKR